MEIGILKTAQDDAADKSARRSDNSRKSVAAAEMRARTEDGSLFYGICRDQLTTPTTYLLRQ